MIYNHNSLADVKELTALNKAWPVSINHYKQIFRFSHGHCLFRGDKFIIIAFLGLLINCLQRFVKFINNYERFLVGKAAEPHDSQRCTEAVHIRISVTHYKYFLGLIYKLFKSMSHYSRLAFVALFNSLKLSAVIFNFNISFNYRLISSSSQGKIKCSVGVFFCLRESSSAYTYSYTQAGRKICTCLKSSYLIKQIKFCCDEFLKILLLKPYYIIAAFYSGC